MVQHGDVSSPHRPRHARSRTSRAWDRLPVPRPAKRPSRHPRLRTWLAGGSSLVALLGLSTTVTALWLLPGEHRLEQTAVRLRDSGFSTTADSARVVRDGSGRAAGDALEASFRTREQRPITVRLLGSGTDSGIERPPRPLTVFYDPTHPRTAMAAEDLRHYTDDAVAGTLTTAALGGLAALAGAGGRWWWRRADP